jgi:hypothetical protein
VRIVLAAVTPESVQQIWMNLGLIAMAIVVLGISVWYYRRWYRSGDSTTSSWTLEDFRKMRDRGELTEAEYQRLRASVLGQVQGGLSSEPVSVKPVGSGKKTSASVLPAGFAESGSGEGETRAGENDASGDTVWSFDLKKTPPG